MRWILQTQQDTIYKIYNTIIFPVALYGRETSPHTLKEEHEMWVSDERVAKTVVKIT